MFDRYIEIGFPGKRLGYSGIVKELNANPLFFNLSTRIPLFKKCFCCKRKTFRYVLALLFIKFKPRANPVTEEEITKQQEKLLPTQQCQRGTLKKQVLIHTTKCCLKGTDTGKAQDETAKVFLLEMNHEWIYYSMLFDRGSDLAVNTARRSEGLSMAKQKVAWDQFNAMVATTVVGRWALNRGLADLIHAMPTSPGFSLAVCTGTPAAPTDPNWISLAARVLGLI